MSLIADATIAVISTTVIKAAAEIARLRAAGYGDTAIARSLNARGIASPSGRGRWHPETVKRFADPHERARYNAYMRGYRARWRQVTA